MLEYVRMLEIPNFNKPNFEYKKLQIIFYQLHGLNFVGFAKGF